VESLFWRSKWKDAASMLLKAESIKTIVEKIYWIDEVLDLQHNTGFILNKTEFMALFDKRLGKSSKNKNN
jgi:hypothetical protein